MPIINNGTSFSQPRVAHIAAVIMAALRRHDDGLVEPVPAPQPVPSDGLKTPAQAAQRLGVSPVSSAAALFGTSPSVAADSAKK
jgi:hypothetical protein